MSLMSTSRSSQRLRLGLAILCLFAAVWVVWTAGLPDPARVNAVLPIQPGQTPVAPEVGAIAPGFDKPDVSGQRLSLVGLRGVPVLLNFWATWCGPCVTETPLLQAAYEANQADGLRVIGIDANEPLADVLVWQTRFRVSYDLLIDDGLIAALYRIRGLPSSYFIGRDGVIRYIVFGPLSETELQNGLVRIR